MYKWMITRGRPLRKPPSGSQVVGFGGDSYGDELMGDFSWWDLVGFWVLDWSWLDELDWMLLLLSDRQRDFYQAAFEVWFSNFREFSSSITAICRSKVIPAWKELRFVGHLNSFEGPIFDSSMLRGARRPAKKERPYRKKRLPLDGGTTFHGWNPNQIPIKGWDQNNGCFNVFRFFSVDFNPIGSVCMVDWC